MNQVNFSGNVTADAVHKDVGGAALTEFSVAINKKYKNKAGEEVKEVSFVECKAWRWASHISKGLKKGEFVTVSGELKQDRWEDANTKQNRSKLYVVAFMVAVVPKDDSAKAAPDGGDVPF
jgi:single-strand DNA-binding protein